MWRYLWGNPDEDQVRDPVYHATIAMMWAMALFLIWTLTPWSPLP